MSRLALPFVTSILFVSSTLLAVEPSLTLNVWPALPPGDQPNLGAEKWEANSMLKGVVTTPTLAVYRPAKEKDNGAAVLIAPGGGFYQLSMGHEGADVATWLNSIGVTGIVLKYRIPTREGMARSLPMTQDAQRAMSLIRAKAAEWGLDPKRIGICGFSAGGEVAVNVLSNPDRRLYPAIDAIDQTDMRPNFSLLIYSGGILKRDASPPALNDGIVFTRETPPAFLSVSHDDRGVEQTVLLYLALKRAGVPAEMHVWSEGGHGYGIRPGALPHTTWPARAADWLKVRGFLKPSAATERSP
ncbi:MAG: alpha/beta hydrolase [Opitutus sp.]|nr:alpha/beta hydrolase [Opitutus sp.]